MSKLLTVILAAGKGTRMKSRLPKVLHKIGGKPMVEQVLCAANEAGSERNVVIIGFGAEKVKEHLEGRAQFAMQEEQLGTGHAVMQARDILADWDGTVLVVCGDTPLLTPELLKNLCQEHEAQGAKATVLTAKMPDPTGYGRVIRDSEGVVVKIVEQKDASEEEKLVDEVNTAIYCFDAKALLGTLDSLTCENAQGEYYLTDVIGILRDRGERVWAVVADDPSEVQGINSRVQLAQAQQVMKERKNRQLMEAGVTIIDPASTFVDTDVEIGMDTVLYPYTWLSGKTKIGENSVIGPNVMVEDSVIGNDVQMKFVYAHECTVKDGVTVGPYVHLRPNTVIENHVKIGNFIEVKNSTVGEGSKLPHLSYIGDTDMGARVNIGCGTIMVNYDGQNKHRTTIEDDAFIGCNRNLVAPVTIGRGAFVAAGSTITKNVPEDALGVARAVQKNIDGWAEKKKK